MTRKEVLKRAGATFDKVLKNPSDPNAKVIGARRGNNSSAFDAKKMIPRADNAGKRLDHAQAAASQLEPDLDRFKA
jgi:hypothetical protein